MRVLMMSTPAPTHFTPLVSLAWALRGAGMRWCRGPAGCAGAVASAGLVTLGSRTLALNGLPLMRGILRAFEELPEVEAVDEVFREKVGPVPANVRMVDPVPLHLVLDGCAAVVHHGGAGTTTTAGAFGPPQLVLPQLADHFGHGDRVSEVGAGISLDDAASQNDSHRLAVELRRLLAEPEFAKAAGALADSVRDMPAPAHVAADLTRVAGVVGAP